METDYLVVGSGASAMAFVDVMLEETDATFTVVDTRHRPGGHWNDAYPFVRLHQPAAFYGVASRELGRRRKNASGLNRGFYELASGVAVAAYYHALLDEVFLPSGRVEYFPVSRCSADGEVVSLLSGERRRVEVRRKRVDATHMTTNIPLTHERKFDVAPGVVCEPPNDLPRLAPRHSKIMILGGGKTAIDSATWLLGNGYPADSISWVVPRDSWFLNRAHFQPGFENFELSIGGLAAQNEACAAAESLEDLCIRMEQTGQWLRLDENVWPRMFHAATISELELAEMRRIGNVIRLGHVRRIEPDEVVFDEGAVASDSDTLYVDCTASALDHNVGDRTPVFQENAIVLQMIRPFQPCFSAALIGHMEASIDDASEKQGMALPTPMTDTVEDWLRVQSDGLINAGAWGRNPEITAWMSTCRLNAFADIFAAVPADDRDKQAVLARMLQAGPAAVENLQRLAARLDG